MYRFIPAGTSPVQMCPFPHGEKDNELGIFLLGRRVYNDETVFRVSSHKPELTISYSTEAVTSNGKGNEVIRSTEVVKDRATPSMECALRPQLLRIQMF